jgi:ABC-2 type transport system ATP-binding protein
MSNIVIRTQNLKKYFGDFHAVEDVSMEIKSGNIFGFLGPNGAGKTTTIGMLLGLIHPTAGSIEIFGEKINTRHNPVLNRVGTLVGASPAIVPYLTARENLALITQLDSKLTNKDVEETIELVNLSEAANRKAGHFSTGMKQRLGIAMALIHKPDLLIMDEPTNGMDPTGMQEIRQLLRNLADKGTTIMLSSHLLHEVEQICDEVMVINKGLVITQGKVKDLLSTDHIIRIRVENPHEAKLAIANLENARIINQNCKSIEITGVDGQTILGHLVKNNIVPQEVTEIKQDLESLFLSLIQKSAA